jgi:KEOPS complex subunit Pcc1
LCLPESHELDEENLPPRLQRKLKRRSAKNKASSQRVTQKTSIIRRRAEITIEINLESSKLAETIQRSILPETGRAPGFRSRTRIARNDRVLTLNVRAEDVVALRAAVNTFLRFVSVAMKTLDVVAPFYTAQHSGPIQSDTGKQIE